MGLKHIFISHARQDVDIANKLATHLRDAGHDIMVDTHDLNLGANLIAFINESIANAYMIIILFSKHTPNAKWQMLEINSALWNEFEQSGAQCIVVRLDNISIPPLLGPKVYGNLDPGNSNSLRNLIEEICKSALPEKTSSSIVTEALASTSKNPFRHIRAEFFENRHDLIAKAFAPPDQLKVASLEDMKPCLLEGSRGTGKSMLLLSMRARIFLLRFQNKPNNYNIFGFYLKLTPGSLCNVGIAPDTYLNNSSVPSTKDEFAIARQISDLAYQEFIIQLIESLLSELEYCINQKLINCEPEQVKALSIEINSQLFNKEQMRFSSLDELLKNLAEKHRHIAEFIRRRFIYNEQIQVPVANLDLDAFKNVINTIRKSIPSFHNFRFLALLDEYENLSKIQQRIVNDLVKLGPPEFSVKIAKKLGSSDTFLTTIGQEIQETHDYTRIALVYDLEDNTQLKAYHNLLHDIVQNILRTENLKIIDINELLPKDESPEISDEKIKPEILKLCKVTNEEFDSWPQEKRSEKWVYYREAAIYRALLGGKGKHADKRFSGFEQLAFVSSGVIRYFLEILSVAYHLTYGSGLSDSKKIIFKSANQSRALQLVSQHYLTTLSRSVECYGETLKYFILDIGRCLKYKLLNHTSEPEAARLTIEDPERLETSEMDKLKTLLSIGIREGVFQTKEGFPAFKPKHTFDPQPSEFNICRIFAPVLEISPRLRWRTNVKCKYLLELLLPNKRAEALERLNNIVVKSTRESNQEKLKFPE